MDLHQASKEELIKEVLRLRREIHEKNENLHIRNLQLDAMHWVWCDGICPGGVHRHSDQYFTEDIVLFAELNTARLRKKYNGMAWVIENWPKHPSTQSEFHRRYIENIKHRLGVL